MRSLVKGSPKKGVLILGEAGLPKQGKASVGAQHQYCGALSKQDTCQVMVSVEYVADDPTAVYTRVDLCDKMKTCEHTLTIYDSVFCTWSISGSHEQRLVRHLKPHEPRSSDLSSSGLLKSQGMKKKSQSSAMKAPKKLRRQT